MPDIESIRSVVLARLREHVTDGREIGLDSEVIADAGLDSVSVMDLVLDLEDEFDVTVPLDRIAEVKTGRELADALHGLLKQTA